MRTHVGRHGYVVALCDFCPNTAELIGLQRAEERVTAKGWTIRHGKARCPACTELERAALARAVRFTLPR
jgi:hypothetical protein